MAKIGEYRFKVYELLFRKPICSYAETVGNSLELNVLIVGNGWLGNEAFKASFWAGQYLNSKLNITVASQNASKYKNIVLSTEKDAVLPSLSLFAERKKYANLSFKDIFVSESQDEFAPLELDRLKYNYIIISLGDVVLNFIAAQEITEQIAKAQTQGTVSYNGKRIINVFNEFSNDIAQTDLDDLNALGEKNGIEINFFGEVTESFQELERIARNINFSYEIKYNQRSGKATADKNFDESKNSEFVQSPHDYETDNLKIVSNFIGSLYAADSSFASAVHVPYKLSLCRTKNESREAIDVLKEEIKTKGTLYKNLVALEHRRWNAYMVMRGYRAPTKEEETTLLYQGNNTHQDKQRLLHIGLCDCDNEGAVLDRDFNKQYRLWIHNNCPDIHSSELNRASLRCHQLSSFKVRNLKIQDILKLVSDNSVEYINFRISIQKLFNDEENSLSVYERAYEKAKTYAASISVEELNKIKEADKKLNVVKVRNRRMDFLSLDAQLIEMIPFSIWYGVKYRNIITISNGNACQDVIVPTLFSAQNATFIGTEVDNKSYKNSVVSYFCKRGSVTAPNFVKIPYISLNNIITILKEQINTMEINDFIINCVPHDNTAVFLAMGCLTERYDGKINIVQYDSDKGIVSLSGNNSIGIGLLSKSFSVNEFIGLMGGKIVNEFSSLYDTSQYDFLLDLLKRFSNKQCYTNEDDSKGSFIPWNKITEFFAKNAKIDNNIDECLCRSSEATVPFEYRGEFISKVFNVCNIGQTLIKLQEYRIISNYHENVKTASVEVEFIYYDSYLSDVLAEFTSDICKSPESLNRLMYKKIKFQPMHGLRITDCYVDNKKLFTEEEPEAVIKTKNKIMNEFCRHGFIKDLTISKNGEVSFYFKDEQTMNMLKTQGNAFELVIYHIYRQSGVFDDIETGIKISWNQEEKSLNQILIERLHSENGSYGYKSYAQMRKQLLSSKLVKPTENEIDIIAIKGMTPIFVSCKTGNGSKLDWLYEISSLSSHFMSHGVLAVAGDQEQTLSQEFLERAKQINISVLEKEVLWNEDKLLKVLKTL